MTRKLHIVLLHETTFTNNLNVFLYENKQNTHLIA